MPATTTPFDDRRSRLERILALARLSLAVLAALVLRIDPLAVVTALPRCRRSSWPTRSIRGPQPSPWRS